MAIDATAIASDMLSAMKGELTDAWPDIKDYAEAEAKKLAQTFLMIEKLKLSNQIDEEEAEIHLNMAKNASKAVFLAIEGMGLIVVERAINAALDVVSTAVNTALGFTLI